MDTAFSRRNFMLTGAMAAVAAAVPSSAPAERAPRVKSGRPSPVRLGLASYTFRNFSRAQMISDMQELKIFDLNAKDTKDHLPMDPAGEEEALAAYKAAGIRLHAVGAVYFEHSTDEDIRNKFEYAKRAGVDVIVAGDPTPKTLPRIEKYVQEFDIKLAIHNHGPEDKLFPSPFDVLKVVKHMDPRIGCCIDVGHSVRAGADIPEAVHAAGPRLFDMHMKDLTDFNDKDSQVAVGDGKMPVHQIFEALIAIKYPGFVDLEYEVHGDDPMPGVTKSFAYMRGVLAGMGYSTTETA